MMTQSRIARTRRTPRLMMMLAVLGVATFTLGAFAQQSRSRGEGRPATEPRTPQVDRGGERERPPLLGRRIAVLVGDGAHDLETLVPIGYLTNRGARVHVIGIEPGMVKTHDGNGTILVERGIEDQRPIQYDALVIPGGKSPATLRGNRAVVSFAKEFFESGRPVAAICHGPQLLITAGVMDGKTATCYPEVSSELQTSGAKYVDEAVVRDGNLITSRVPEDLAAFCAAVEQAVIEHPASSLRDRGRGNARPSRDRGAQPDRGGRDATDRPQRPQRPGRGGDDPTRNERPR